MGRHVRHTALSQHLSPRFLRRFVRRSFRRIGLADYQVVFHEAYNTGFPNLPVDPLRADRILAFLASEGFVLRQSVHRPEPVWMKALAMVHTPEYLDALQDEKQLGRIMGFEVAPSQVDRMVDYQRLQTGGTLMATRRALRRGVAVHLGGGFHHAHPDHGEGFCIFNDIAVAIRDERRRGFKGRVLVIDLDLHDGNGTREIFADDSSVHTFSIHARHWQDTEAVESTSIELGNRVDDDTYLQTIAEHLPPLFERFKPKLVLYLAGCDVACDDQLGNWKIRDAAMLQRDQQVFQLCRSYRRGSVVPLVILLAGGYSPDAWRYSARFLANLRVRKTVLEPPSTDEITFKRYRFISRLLDPRLLSGGDMSNDFGLTEEDLFLPGWGVRRESRFLGFYTKTGIEIFLERSGFLDRLRNLDFQHPTLELQLNDPAGDALRLFGDADQQELLAELRVLRDRRTLPGFETLSVEWLMMQNPRAEFHGDHRPLPGQEHPGLGMFSDVIAVLRLACERLGIDGLSFVPSNYLIASYSSEHLPYFIDPDDHAQYEALKQALQDLPLAEATRAVVRGQVLNDDGGVYRWRARPMVFPISRRLRQELNQRQKDHTPKKNYRFHLASRASQSGPSDSVE